MDSHKQKKQKGNDHSPIESALVGPGMDMSMIVAQISAAVTRAAECVHRHQQSISVKTMEDNKPYINFQFAKLKGFSCV